MKAFQFIIATAAITAFSSCVRNELYDTDHPDHGKVISLTVTWDDRGEGIDIPSAYTAKIGDYAAVLSDTDSGMENLFPAGAYTMNVWNDAENITVSGTTATAAYSNGLIGWLFTGTENVNIEKDKNHAFTVAMRQMVRQLTLELDITGAAKDRITGIEASFSGVAGAINIENGNPEGAAVTVIPVFAQAGGKYSAAIRLLGITGNAQTLSLTLHFAGGNPSTHTLASDLSDRLAAFNADRKTPMTLAAILTVTPAEAGFQAVIGNWTGSGGDIIAN
ncbi:MAG: FimB/Mfa2 family fimbrial subunit [Bacteroidales bacterium]|jgi:hypothetical protein|nr:FimB/Mfa2 family fimbrial subunit [Bacteroidales bacterium]